MSDLFISVQRHHPPPPLSLRAGSEGTSPSSYSPGIFGDPPVLPHRGAPPLSASARMSTSTTSQHFDLNNSVGAMSLGTPSSSTSGGPKSSGHGHGPHFDFNQTIVTPPPPPRPPPHRPQQAPVNSLSTFDDAM